MGEEEMCEGGCKWEETMYWTHFQTMHFCLFLVGDFVHEFAIPQKFAKHLKEKLPDVATLKGPSGITWTVGLVTSGDNMFFKDGWNFFVTDHSLQENDILVFKYQGGSRFDVLIFDPLCLCEKETSYFVRKCGHTTDDVGLQTMDKTRDSSVDAVHASLYEDVESPSAKKLRKDDIVMQKPLPPGPRRDTPRANTQIRKRTRSISPVTNRQIPKRTPSISPVMPRWKLRNKEPFACVVEEQAISEEADAEKRETSNNRDGGYQLQYVSNRRPVTDSEKEKALQLAQAASTNESFILVMRPTHVYKRFYLRFPSEWADSRISMENQDIILLYKDKTWCTRYDPDGRGGGALSSGWKDFALENNLEEYDVCRFELASPAGNTIVMNVSIFRVLEEELVPLTRVSPASPPKVYMSEKSKKHKVADFSNNIEKGRSASKSSGKYVQHSPSKACKEKGETAIPHGSSPEVELGSKVRDCVRMMSASAEEKVAQSFTSRFPNFVRIMKKSNISGSYTLKVPHQFSLAHLPNCKTEIVLRNSSGECWNVNSVPARNRQTAHTFCGGWMAFIRGNNVKIGDICIFEFVGKNEMLVHISEVGKKGEDHQNGKAVSNESLGGS